MKQLNNKKGFTLIEVVLVLAIGGLIFLLAFLAFQQVSTNRRDTQRRSDVARFVGEVQNYIGDSNSTQAPDAATFNGNIKTNYLKNPTGPDGNAYIFGTTVGKDNVNYVKGAASQTFCDGSTPMTGSSDFKITIGLEKGSSCRDTK